MKSDQGGDPFFIFLSQTPGLLAIIKDMPVYPFVYTRFDFLRLSCPARFFSHKSEKKPIEQAQPPLLQSDHAEPHKVENLPATKESQTGLSQFIIEDYVSTSSDLTAASVEVEGVKSDCDEKFDNEDDQGVCEVTGIPVAAFYRVGQALFEAAQVHQGGLSNQNKVLSSTVN